jgi:N-acyl-D-amino-acid deacylase
MGDADLQARLIRESKASMHILRETQPMVAQVVNGFDRQPLPGDPVDYEPTPDRAITTLASVNGVEPIEEFYEQLRERNGAALLTMPFLGSAHRNGDALYEMLTRWARDRTRGPKLPLQSVVKKMTADAAALCGLTDRGVLEVGKCADVITREHDQFTGARPGRLIHL